MRALTQRTRMGLLLTTAISSALCAGAAIAQPAASAGASDQLEQVVVTATRQVDTVNHVALAVTAQTQRALDQQGVRSVRDLEQLVPSLSTTQSLASGASQFSIRGIGFLGNGQAGAAPVGFYLDDVPLQKRNVGGGVATSNGTPLPPLFDLERVEVLRGPQGTLFGGGSEGGTIRYIQPEPSLTRFSEYARAQYSHPDHGDDSHEFGVAVGGPIIQDKLGFRASVFTRDAGGFISHIDPLTKKEWAHNTGGEDKIRMLRGALAWAPTEKAKVTFSFFSSVDKSVDITNTYNTDVPGTVTIPTLCFNTNNTPSGGTALTNYDAAGNNTTSRIGPVGSIQANPAGASKINPYPVARGDAACATRAAAGDVTYTLPGFSYGPYDLNRYDSLVTALAPSKTNLQIADLTFDYDFGKVTMKSITSYIDDQTKTVTEQRTPQGGYRSLGSYTDPVFGLRTLPTGPNFNPAFGPTAANISGFFVSNNRRYGITQEVRFASNNGPDSRLSWIAGVYYSNLRGKAGYDNYQPLEFFSQRLYGLSTIQRYGVNGIQTAPGLFNNFDKKRQTLKDTEIAGFAEANFWLVPDKLKATAGIRMSRVSFDYVQTFEGPVTSVGPENNATRNGISFNAPNSRNGGYNAGSTSESPVTPKFGLQYNIDDRSLLYVTAAKGFRAGGVNSQVSYGICQTALDAIGYLPEDLPATYKSDSVWSYELGGKISLFNRRAQVNAAVYRIDWSNPQYTTNPGSCGLVTTFNVPGARSQGFELEVNAKLFRGFTFNGSYGYTDSKYTQDLIFPAGFRPTGTALAAAPFTIVVKGQKIPIPPHTFTVGGRYDFPLTDSTKVYLRGDYRFSASFPVSPFPTTAYTPDAFNQKIQTANFRLGVEYKQFDINAFVNNAFDRKTGVIGGGRSQCLAAASGGTDACTTFAAFTPFRTLNTGLPREIGLQVTFRH